jgi:DNA-binding CsgD family transcriptional regulator
VSDPATVAPRGSDWTPAERRVVEAMRTARSEAEAAALLGISRHTVHQHLRNARSRCGARTTRELLMAVLV